MCQPQTSWPKLPTSFSTTEAGKELVKDPPVLIHALTTSEANPITVNLDKVIDITRYSSKIKLLRVTATVIKVPQFWMNKGKEPQSWTPVDVGDLNKAEERWVQTTQQNCFSEELRVLKSGNPRAASYWPRTFFTPRVFLFSISLLFVNTSLLCVSI